MAARREEEEAVKVEEVAPSLAAAAAVGPIQGEGEGEDRTC